MDYQKVTLGTSTYATQGKPCRRDTSTLLQLQEIWSHCQSLKEEILWLLQRCMASYYGMKGVDSVVWVVWLWAVSVFFVVLFFGKFHSYYKASFNESYHSKKNKNLITEWRQRPQNHDNHAYHVDTYAATSMTTQSSTTSSPLTLGLVQEMIQFTFSSLGHSVIDAT